MHRHAELAQRGQQPGEGVGQQDRACGVGQQKRPGDEHQQPHRHKKRAPKPLRADGKDPKPENRLAGGIKHIQKSGEHDNERHRAHPAQHHTGRDPAGGGGGQQKDQHQPVGQHMGAEQQRRDVGEQQHHFQARIQPVEDGISGEILPKGNIAEQRPQLLSIDN